jgi:hypothetical protein
MNQGRQRLRLFRTGTSNKQRHPSQNKKMTRQRAQMYASNQVGGVLVGIVTVLGGTGSAILMAYV